MTGVRNLLLCGVVAATIMGAAANPVELDAQPPTTAGPPTTEQPTTAEPPTTDHPTTAEPPTTEQPTTAEPPTTEQPTTTEPSTTQETTTIDVPRTGRSCVADKFQQFFDSSDGSEYLEGTCEKESYCPDVLLDTAFLSWCDGRDDILCCPRPGSDLMDRIQHGDTCIYVNNLGEKMEGVCENRTDCAEDRLALTRKVDQCGFGNAGKMCCPLPASGSKPKTDICLQLLWEKEENLGVTYLEETACGDYTPAYCDAPDCDKKYSICVLKERGYVDQDNNINQEPLKELISQSRTGYVFESEEERDRFRGIVGKHTKIDTFVDQHCHEANEAQRKLPVHPNTYCPKGKLPGETVSRFCYNCRVFCSNTVKSTECRIVKTRESGNCPYF